MKKIFIKDDRIGDIEKYLSDQITKLIKEGKIKGSYSSELSWRKVETKEFPGYVCEYGWEITDYEDGWKIDNLDNFEITIKKSGGYYCATCKQFFTENVSCPLMVYGKTVEGTLIKFIKELRKQRKTLCVRGKTIEGKLAKAIYG